ncbi:hypothetical protein [Flavobacterium circumlabens]|uniref:Uncharacterized protein n=1 Tax=Flavobacterium circumlabens TaxID=2133765 RepID=A0ABY2B386_9FLAO|nr:hypothetical protein [Flavobacterium circumlabens]TCN59555.1 hypothetical protein EV142_102173 [Flavobacterium circumlabens]
MKFRYVFFKRIFFKCLLIWSLIFALNGSAQTNGVFINAGDTLENITVLNNYQKPLVSISSPCDLLTMRNYSLIMVWSLNNQKILNLIPKRMWFMQNVFSKIKGNQFWLRTIAKGKRFI